MKKVILSSVISLSFISTIQARGIITGPPPNSTWTAVYYDANGIARGVSGLTLRACNTKLALAAQAGPITILQQCSRL